MRWLVPMLLAVTACASSTTEVPASPADASVDAEAGPTPSPPGSDAPSSSPSAPPTPVSSPVPSTTPAVYPEGFTATAAVATAPDGSTCDLCVWLADTSDRRSRGLMFVTDLGPADAMAFVYPEPHSGTFWMKNTVLPLSIAFYSPDGAFMEAFDMAPCTGDPCPNYRTARGFSIAVEVPQGELDALGLVEGSTLDLLDLPCAT